MEFLGNDPTTLYQSVHYVGGKGTTYAFKPKLDPTQKFHSYGVLVTPTVDEFYVDGFPTHGVPNGAMSTMYFMVSFSIGGPGSWPGPPNSSTPWPSYTYLKYFRAFAPTLQTC
jgi:beta-glucanase (GH16 family)